MHKQKHVESTYGDALGAFMHENFSRKYTNPAANKARVLIQCRNNSISSVARAGHHNTQIHDSKSTNTSRSTVLSINGQDSRVEGLRLGASAQG